MNGLEKIYTLINKDGRKVKYGVLTNETEDPVISVQAGETTITGALHDKYSAEFPTIIVNVYATDHLAGFNMLDTLKTEIKAVIKDGIKLAHVKDAESEFIEQKNKYAFRAYFKEIKFN